MAQLTSIVVWSPWGESSALVFFLGDSASFSAFFCFGDILMDFLECRWTINAACYMSVAIVVMRLRIRHMAMLPRIYARYMFFEGWPFVYWEQEGTAGFADVTHAALDAGTKGNAWSPSSTNTEIGVRVVPAWNYEMGGRTGGKRKDAMLRIWIHQRRYRRDLVILNRRFSLIMSRWMVFYIQQIHLN